MQLSSSTSEEMPRVPHTIVLGCADDEGGDELAAALQGTRPVERIVVLGPTARCARGDSPSEPMQNTAAIAAWYRLAPAARALARERAAGQLSTESFRAKLDTLVRLANLEACHELCAALRRGAVEVRAVVHDAGSGRSELFDGTRFKPIDDGELADLIGRRRARELGGLGDQAQSGFHPLPSAHPRLHEPRGMQESC